MDPLITHYDVSIRQEFSSISLDKSHMKFLLLVPVWMQAYRGPSYGGLSLFLKALNRSLLSLLQRCNAMKLSCFTQQTLSLPLWLRCLRGSQPMGLSFTKRASFAPPGEVRQHRVVFLPVWLLNQLQFQMKATFEKIQSSATNSFHGLHVKQQRSKPINWHF